MGADGVTGLAEWARFVLGACERFGCLPSALFTEDAGLLRLLEIEALCKAPERVEVGGDDWQ